MIKLPQGEVRVELLDGDVLIHVSTPIVATSFILKPEDARQLSSDIFSAFLETQGLGKIPS